MFHRFLNTRVLNDPEMSVILISYKMVCDELSLHIFSMGFLEKYLLRYILLTDQISLSGCLHFLRYCSKQQ